MEKDIYIIDKINLRKIIIKIHNQLKIGRVSNIPSELLADTILDNVEIHLKKLKSNVWILNLHILLFYKISVFYL